MALFSNFFFQLTGDFDRTTILMGDYWRERLAFVVHGDPGGRHDRQADGVDGFGFLADLGDRIAHGFENGARIHFHAHALAAGWIAGTGDPASDFPILENRRFDGGGANVKSEELHEY